MPGPCNFPSKRPCSKGPSSLKPYKKPKASMGSSAAEDEKKRGSSVRNVSSTCMKNVRIRVICTDPDATDSSSDDEADVKLVHVRPTNKRVVRELLIPTSFALPPSVHSRHGEGYVDMKLADNAGRSSTVSCVSKCGGDMGVRWTRYGKWAAEVRDTSRGVRVWLGTPGTAAQPYNDAALHVKGPRAVTDFISPRRHSLENDLCLTCDASGDENFGPLCSSLDALQDSSLGASPVNSDNADSAGSCFLANSPPSVLRPCPTYPNDVYIPYDGRTYGGLSDVFSGECSADSISEMVPNDVERKMTSCFTITDDAMPQKGPVKPEVAGEEVKFELESSMFSFPFMESISCFDDLGQILRKDSTCIDNIPDVRVEYDSSLAETDMNIELDPEALSWINVSDSWQSAM